MMLLALSLTFIAVQLAQPPILPQGWTARMMVMGGDARLEHTSGASLIIRRRRTTDDFNTFTEQTVEGLARPLGFARIGEPRHFSDSNQRWVEYQVRGNRLTERRRILYRAVRSDRDIREIIYENGEGRFDVLLSEALSIASSLESIRRKVRVRQ